MEPKLLKDLFAGGLNSPAHWFWIHGLKMFGSSSVGSSPAPREDMTSAPDRAGRRAGFDSFTGLRCLEHVNA